MGIALFALAVLVSLALVPLGLPGTWLMVAAAMVLNAIAPGSHIGWWAIGVSAVLALLAEVFEWTLAARYARKYGGSSRAGWGAFMGGLIGAAVGVPLPIIGSVIGAFAGAFVGALAAEFTRTDATAGSATKVAAGALLGRIAATALKMATALIIAVVLVGAAWL